MGKPNITLRLPRALLRRVKRVAAARDTSVSALMVERWGNWRTSPRGGCFSPTAAAAVAAIGWHARSNIGVWDATIVLAAAESACDVLWTEDLGDGQVLQGNRIRNPFTSADVAGSPQ